MQDHLVVWLSLAVAFVAAVTVATVGVQPLAVFGLVHVPAALLAMLTLRAVVCLVRRRPVALRVGSREILAGWWGLLVPVLLLSAWVAARETGTIGARLSATTMDDRTNTSWATNSNRASAGVTGGTLAIPATFAATTQFEVVGGDDAMHVQFAAQLEPLAQLLPGYQILGRVELQSTPPLAVLPLWKSASVVGHVVCELFLRETDSGACRATLKGNVDVDGSCTMWGFASQRDFHLYLGTRIGEVTRQPLVDQLQKLADSLR